MPELIFDSPQEALERYKKEEINTEEALAVIRAFPTKIAIPRHCFESQTRQEQIANESDEKYEMEMPTAQNFEKQIYIGVKGAEFPIKTFVDPDMLGAANIVKSLFIEPIKLLSMPQFWPSVAITALHTKSLEKAIESFNRIADRAFGDWILKDEHCTNFTPQFCFLIFTILHQIGISERNALLFATTVSRLIEYDNAYRLRAEDIFSETTKEAWDNPRKELKRLVNIFAERDINWVVIKKVKQLALLAQIAMLIPRVRKAVTYAMKQVHLPDLQLDEQDTFYSLIRRDYNSMGLNYEQRQAYGKARNWKFPNQVPIK